VRTASLSSVVSLFIRPADETFEGPEQCVKRLHRRNISKSTSFWHKPILALAALEISGLQPFWDVLEHNRRASGTHWAISFSGFHFFSFLAFAQRA
jgi:putative protein kinase ArgK-like GTPase of G3E family